MVIGQAVIVECFLPHLLGDRLFFTRPIKLIQRVLFLFLCQLFPFFLFRSCKVCQFFIGHDGNTFFPRESLVADVGTPCHRIAIVQGVVNDFFQFVQGNIVDASPPPVVGQLNDKGFIEWVMRIGAYFHIIVQVQVNAGGKTFRRIGFAVILEFLRNFSEIGIENTRQPILPGRCQLSVRITDHGIHVCFDHLVHFIVHRILLSDSQTRIDFFGYNAIIPDHVSDVVESPTPCEVDITLEPHVFQGFFQVSMVDDEHFRQIVFIAMDPQQFRFQECR